MKRKFIIMGMVGVLFAGLTPSVHAGDFSFTFEWGKIPLCTSGYPGVVPNPIFTLSNVPKGTKKINFALVDRDVPDFDHGGGTAVYKGENVIQPGAFQYSSPCPPSGSHTYEWTAYAKDANDDTVGKAKAKKIIPNTKTFQGKARPRTQGPSARPEQFNRKPSRPLLRRIPRPRQPSRSVPHSGVGSWSNRFFSPWPQSREMSW